MKKFYLGENNLAKFPTSIYYGISNKPKRIKKAYFGIDKKAKLVYEYNDPNIAIINTTIRTIESAIIKQEPTSEYVYSIGISSSPLPIYSTKSDSPMRIATIANKIKIIDNETGNSNGIFWYVASMSEQNKNINVDYFILNELGNFNYCFYGRELKGNIQNLNFNNGYFLNSTFYNTIYSSSGNLIVKGKFNHIYHVFTNAEMPYVNVKFHSQLQASEISTISRVFYKCIFNSIEVIGNFNNLSVLFSNCTTNKIKLKVNTLNFGSLTLSNTNTYIEFNVNCGLNLNDKCFNNFSGGGYIYLNYPNEGYNTNNFIVRRAKSSPTQNLYIHIKNSNKVLDLLNGICPSVYSPYTYTQIYSTPMPDDSKKLYDGYYNESGKIVVLYGE